MEKANEKIMEFCLKEIRDKKIIDKKLLEIKFIEIKEEYNLSEKDITIYKKHFLDKLIVSVENCYMINEKDKEKIKNEIFNRNIFNNKNNEKYSNEDDDFYSKKYRSGDNSDYYRYEGTSYYNFDKYKKEEISYYTFIVTIALFFFLVFLTSFIRVLFNIYGLESVIFINTVIINIISIYVLLNKVIYNDNIDKQNQRMGGLMFIILIFNLINFISIIEIFLRK